MSERKAAVIGPVSGGRFGWPFGAFFGDIRKLGYVEEEYFLEGEAVHYKPKGKLKHDGQWTLQEEDTSPFRTRILVRRPLNAESFNGTVVLEWANVSYGYEISFCDPEELYEKGFAYVSVSAQIVGVTGFASSRQGLLDWDPDRYGSLHIPDEGISFDIFTQAARAVGPGRDTSAGPDPMGGLRVERLIGAGGSQSGGRVLAYANGVQPLENAFDALMPMFNGGTGIDFDRETVYKDRDKSAAKKQRPRAMAALMRSDTAVPIMTINSESEALFAQMMSTQPDSANTCTWEIAGASHAPTYQMQRITQKTDRDGLSDSLCTYKTHTNSNVRWFPVVGAALLHVQEWIKNGTPPPAQPRIAIDPKTKNYLRDEHGNVVGGVRLPDTDVPIASYCSGAGYVLGGYTTPFDAAKLKALYPTRESYVAKVKAAAEKARDAGVITESRVEEYVKMAEAAPVPEPFPVPESKINMKQIAVMLKLFGK